MNSKQLMLRDGAPAALFLTPAQRTKAWQGVLLRAMPLFEINKTRDESPETAAFREQEEERRRLKSLEGIARMKLRMASKAIDFSKVRWDARRNKFVPLEGQMSKSEPLGLLNIKRGLATVNRAVEDMKRKPMPLEGAPTEPALFRPSDLHGAAKRRVDAALVATEDWSRVNKDTAATLAKLNGVWDDKYAKLSGGLLVMTVTNRLKGLVKKGGEVKWN